MTPSPPRVAGAPRVFPTRDAYPDAHRPTHVMPTVMTGAAPVSPAVDALAPAPRVLPASPALPARVKPAEPPATRTWRSTQTADAPAATGWAGPHTRRWQVALGALSVLVLLTVCGLGSYLIVQDERQGADARAAGADPAPTAKPRDISSRAADPTPLTAKEVFPQSKITIAGTAQAYQVIKTQASKDCRIAADQALRKLLTSLKCSQVVRATLRSPSKDFKDYLVTGGILNLETAAGAQQAKDKIQSMVDRNAGRFLGFVAGKDTEPLALSSTHVGWDTRGHYLAYCLIARADGREIAEDDPYARLIMYDIVELHLQNTVLQKRATVPVNSADGG